MENFTKKGLEGILILVSIIGWIVGIIALLFFAPWGPGLGFPFSTERLIAAYVIYYSFLIPPGLYFVVWQFKRPKYLAPVGKYSEGVKVNPVSPYHLVAMGVMGALFAATGYFSAFNIDLASFTAAFTGIYFGPWITMVALLVGNFLRFLSGTAYWLTPINVALNGVTDAMVWVISGGLYLRFSRDRQIIKNKLLNFVVFYAIAQAMHFFMWGILYSFVQFPIEGAIQNMIGTATSWYPGAIVFTLVGFYVAQSMFGLRTESGEMGKAPAAPQ